MKKDIYIFSSGTLQREADTLCLARDTDKKFIPVSNVSSIFVFGEITLNKRLLEFLTTNQIPIHFYNYYGFYIGTFYPRIHYNSGFLTLKQSEYYLDRKKRLSLAKKFVEGGLNNMLRNLKYYENRKGGLSNIIEILEKGSEKIPYAESTEELMAIEGEARKNYYQAFNVIIENPEFRFESREKRPPKHYLDALIGFGNSLLYVTILAEIYKTHLDPRIGFLHSTNFRKFSLNLDVSEVFKPIIVDRTIFSVINKNIIDSRCFIKELEGVYLNHKGRIEFVKKFNEKLLQTINIDNRKTSYRRLIRIELYKLEKHLIGEKEYFPFLARW
ncbi:MAG: type I-B CRISPR-associated endonuclease Cas1b [Thermoproteota archaeon]